MIALMIDADNISSPAWVDEACHSIERSNGSISIRRAYGSAENLKGLADVLRLWSIRPFVNLSLTKNTTDVSLAVDAMELACQTPQPKIFVIASGDLDFLPLVVRLRERGIRVVCISVRSKMAQDALSAYDQVIYIGESATLTKEVITPVSVNNGNDEIQNTVTALPSVKATASEPAVMKLTPAKKTSVAKVPAKKAPAKKTPAKKASVAKVPAKKAPSKKVTSKNASVTTAPAKKVTGNATKAVTVQEILSVTPCLNSGQWQPLGEVVKILHDKKILGKNASSTKLFGKFPDYFEITPIDKPNKIRWKLNQS